MRKGNLKSFNSYFNPFKLVFYLLINVRLFNFLTLIARAQNFTEIVYFSELFGSLFYE
jgi:hypothetical protein